MNQVSMIGRFVREVTLNFTTENKPVLNNTLAVRRRFKNEHHQTADFIPVIAWGSVATVIADHCEKGMLVGTTGRIQSRTYMNKQDEKIFSLEYIIEEIQFLQPKKSE
ncbi:single-stranded DNA-binding protein [Isobaculum melis]|uniref:Single-stranded DNA-binding protein n=1 Tax=Isobaculum melis TaxID=142588 RepID=A0A1H9PW56_9LACT|nr:single-stranded DNA-binding protein [Isobaculum melis]SER52526.1 single-strand DNA-binding protein [Isobaculum melis]